ncbi:ADP-ribosylglycohydrolase family protein (plasmid) [Cereibacter sphaeroides]|nr:ADP-ribosylglycohydrolase family protein [Cereibacter sphaeroides]
MTELSRDASGVEHRTGSRNVFEPVPWKRLIGGRSGVTVDLPAGTYSDDTQLRLCVSRAIRANGSFDVEAFAKVEVTVWQGYCLGAGVGSKAAAMNLSKRGVNWFSNFFATDRQNYVTAGGNGAAMRIQPHVWSARGSIDELALRIMRDAVVTHGHPHGFCGALFHALCLWETLSKRAIPSIQRAEEYVSYCGHLPELIERDNELASFWRPTWEREAKESFDAAIRQFQEEALRDIAIAKNVINGKSSPDYHELLIKLGCLTDQYRGSGFKTAFAALLLSELYTPEGIEDALVRSANELDSDTDTIATMTGAILGALSSREPSWIVQDAEYLRAEALRMANIAQNQDASSFVYPDVATWEPPSTQSDSVVTWNSALALAGIGELRPRGGEYKSGASVWQWFELPFGQSILAKRRTKVTSAVGENQMPRSSPNQRTEQRQSPDRRQPDIFDHADRLVPSRQLDRREETRHQVRIERFPGLDRATDIIIASGFDDATIGRLINLAIDDTGGIEAAVALSAIIGKAQLARKRRR